MANKSIDKALHSLDVIEKSDNRIKGIARSGILKRTPQKQAPEQPPAKNTPATVLKQPAQPGKPRTPWGTMPSLSDIALRREQAAKVQPAKPFTPLVPGRKMTVHEQQQYRLEQARQKEAARK